MSYRAGVLNAGTTLPLVGIAATDGGSSNAVRKFQNAAEEARARMRDDFRIRPRTSRIA